MHPLLVLALLVQARPEASVPRDSADTARKRVVSVNIGVGEKPARDREARRVPVTDEHRRTAFASPLARQLLERARAARLSQDSALLSYDATAYFRVSVGMSFSKLGRDRLLFRHENATRVRWHRDVGAWIDVKGARTALPMVPQEAEDEAQDEISGEGDVTMLPYFPGQEPLLSFHNSDLVQSQVDERDLVHPLAEGAEAYYQYEAGDSVVFRLPDARTIDLRELKVRPRESRWNVAVGSLWFDARTGQLVRAAYRLAVPMDIWAVVQEEDPQEYEDIPVWVRPMLNPMRAQISAIVAEYSLHEGRFWLPRIRSAEGHAQVSFMRAPFKFEQSFRYASVNALDSLPEIQIVSQPEPPDSLTPASREHWRDSVREARRAERRAQRDSARKGLRPPIPEVCDTSTTRLVTRRRESGLKVAVRVPCDRAVLATAPELPKSIYDEGEELFGVAERELLIKEALAMGVQPPFAPGAIPPKIHWGLAYTRFNRVEGLSVGALVEQPLGAGYTATLQGRIGHADLEPNVELGLARTNLSRTIRARAYNRLVAANDWGNPLSFGSSVSALLFGRDEGFYYRASGGEIEWQRERGSFLSWRLFAERQRPAAMDNEFSLGAAFVPNVAARTGTFGGVATRWVHSLGTDPMGLRLLTDARAEAAVSDSATAAYGRGAVDLTISRGLAGGRATAALTLSGGSSIGQLPVQRRWFLGGAHTVRGQRPDTALSGNAYWLTRFELGGAVRALRPVVFGDLGWVGDRERLREVGRPMSGVGIGVSIMDGLIRGDLSRGIHPGERVRFDLYLNARL